MNRPVFLDTLMKAQAEVIEHTYECDSCGENKPESELEDRIKHECGDWDNVLICLDCIRRGWDSWGDPRT